MEIIFKTCYPRITIKLSPASGYIDIHDNSNGYSTSFHQSEIEIYMELIDGIPRTPDNFLTEDFEMNFSRHFEGNYIDTGRIDTILDCLKQFADRYDLIYKEIDIDNINKKQLENMSIYKLSYLYKKIKNRGQDVDNKRI